MEPRAYYKIMFVIDQLCGGGAERVTSVLATSLSDNERIEVYICVLKENENEYDISDKVTIMYKEQNSDSKIIEAISDVVHIRKSINRVKPDIVVSLSTYRTNILLQMVCIIRRFIIVLSERNDPERYPGNRIMRWLRNMAYYLCDGVVFQTEGAQSEFSDYIKRKSTIILNPVQVDRHIIYAGSREKTIVNCSRLTSQKNIPLLLTSFKRFSSSHPEYSLHIYGEGELRDELIEATKRLGIENRVVFHGYIKNAMSEIRKASLYVSTSDYEGLSNSVLEAMALGIPTISTDSPPGGARTVIENGLNGLLVPTNDIEALVRAMEQVIDDTDLAVRLSENAKKITERLSVKRIATLWMEFFLRL